MQNCPDITVLNTFFAWVVRIILFGLSSMTVRMVRVVAVVRVVMVVGTVRVVRVSKVVVSEGS